MCASQLVLSVGFTVINLMLNSTWDRIRIKGRCWRMRSADGATAHPHLHPHPHQNSSILIPLPSSILSSFFFLRLRFSISQFELHHQLQLEPGKKLDYLWLNSNYCYSLFYYSSVIRMMLIQICSSQFIRFIQLN